MGRGKLGSLGNMLSIITKYLRDRYARSSVNRHFVILTNNFLGNNLPYCPIPQNKVLAYARCSFIRHTDGRSGYGTPNLGGAATGEDF